MSNTDLVTISIGDFAQMSHLSYAAASKRLSVSAIERDIKKVGHGRYEATKEQFTALIKRARYYTGWEIVFPTARPFPVVSPCLESEPSQRDDSVSFDHLKKELDTRTRELNKLSKLVRVVSDQVLEAITPWPAPPDITKIVKPSKGDNEFDIVFHFGDWHGQLNWIDRYIERTSLLIQDNRGKIGRIVCVFGGDLCESTSLHLQSPYESNMNMARMTQQVGFGMSRLIHYAASFKVPVLVVIVIGNHARTEGVRAPAHDYDNWDLMAGLFAQVALKNTKNVDWVFPDECEKGEATFDISDSLKAAWPFLQVEWNNFLIGIAHGQTIKTQFGTGSYGARNFIKAWALGCKPERANLRKMFFLHHFHEMMCTQQGKVLISCTGTTQPITAWAAGKGYAEAPASQNMLVINNRCERPLLRAFSPIELE